MASKRDYYEVLGVSKNATDDELKAAYRKLAMKLHPDRCKDPDAKDKFAEVNEAYEVLSNKDKRAQYDQFGFDGPQGFANGPGEGFDPFSCFRSHFGGMGGFESMFSDVDDSPFGFNRHYSRRNNKPDFNSPENGNDLQMNLDVTFKESLHGCIKDITLDLDKECPDCHGKGIEEGSTPATCPHCNGTGQVVTTVRNGFMMSQTISPCPYCHGEGMSVDLCKRCHGSKRIPTKTTISVKIPQGIDSGKRLRVHGKGQCGVKGGSNGDMYIRINVRSNDVFERHGTNIVTKALIDPITATLGGKTTINTPWGKIDVDVPAKSTNGSYKVVNGYGVKTKSDAGDLIVVFEISPLDNLNNRQLELLKDLQNTLHNGNTFGAKEHQRKVEEALES